MKTNVTIRIDEDLVQNAKELDLNFSKIAEDALKLAIEEETKPYGIIGTSQILFEAELIYNLKDKELGLSFTLINATPDNIISDRTRYWLVVTDRESFTDLPYRQGLQAFNGMVFERATIAKGGRVSFSEKLAPSLDLESRLSQVTYEDSKNLRWIVYLRAVVDSRKRVLEANYKQEMDEKGYYPIPRPLKIF